MFTKTLTLTAVILFLLSCQLQAGILDSFEPDDNHNIAKEIQPNSQQTHSIVPATDVDWVFFQLIEESEVVIETSGQSGDTRVWLYDSTLNELGYDDDGGTGSFSRIELRGCQGGNALPTGLYYVKVDEYGNDNELAAYNITLTITSCTEQITSTWVGGEHGLWNDPRNWEPLIVPNNNETQTFIVTIDRRGMNGAAVALEQSYAIDRLDCYGEVSLEQGTPYAIVLTTKYGLINHGNLEPADFEVMGDVINDFNACLELDTVWDIFGNLYNRHNATIVNPLWLNIGESEDDHTKGGNLYNEGMIQLQPSATLESLNLYNNGTGIIQGSGVVRAEELLENDGIIYATGPGLVVSSDGFIINTGTLGNKPLSSLHINPVRDINNFGTVLVNAGGAAFDCNLVNEPNGVIKLLGGTLAATTITQKAGSTFQGFGGITGNVVIEPYGLIKFTGPTNIVGDVNITPNAILEISDGTVLITGQTTCNGTIHTKGGRIIPQGGLSGNCNIISEPSAYANIADFSSDGHANFKDLLAFGDTWLWQEGWY